MIGAKDRITGVQVAVIISNLMLGSGILTLPRLLVEKVGTPDVWISVIIGGVLAITAGIIMASLTKIYPNQTIYQFNRHIIGKWMGGLLSLIMIVYFMVIAAYQLRALNEVTSLFLLEGTPSWAIIMLFMWVSLYLLTGGINPIARFCELALPITVVIFLVVILMGLKTFDINNLRPMLGENIIPVLKGASTTTLSFTGIEIILILTAFMNDSKRAVKAVVYGAMIPIVIYLITVIMVIGSLSIDVVVSRTWPTLDLVRSFEVSGFIFERFDSLLLVIWIIQIYTSYTIAYYASALGLSLIFKWKLNKCMFGLLPFVFITTMIPKNAEDLYGFGVFVRNCSMYLFGLIPIILLLIAKWRRGSQI